MKKPGVMIAGLDEAFEKSILPNKVYMPYVEEILLNMRKHYYKL